MAETLAAEEVEANLPEGWQREDGLIRRTFRFEEYMRGITFTHTIAEIAEVQSVVPEAIVIRDGGVIVRLGDKQAGGVTESDLQLAEFLNAEA